MNALRVLSSSKFVSSVDMSDWDKQQIIASSENKGLSVDDYMVDGEFQRNAWIADVLSTWPMPPIEVVRSACADVPDSEFVHRLAEAVDAEIKRTRTPDREEFSMMFKALNQRYEIKPSDYATLTRDPIEYFNSWMAVLVSRTPTEALREHLAVTALDGRDGLRFHAIMEAELQQRSNLQEDGPPSYPNGDL